MNIRVELQSPPPIGGSHSSLAPDRHGVLPTSAGPPMGWYSQRDSLSRAAQASLPEWAAPAAHKQPGGPESFSGKETAHSGSSQNLLYSGASRAGMASAHSATPPPPSTPKSPSPDPGAIPQGDMGGEDTPRPRQQAQEASLLPSGT